MLRRWTVLTCALVLSCLMAAGQRTEALEVDGGTLGTLPLVMPPGEARGIVFLFSDETGRTAELDRAAERLAGLGAITAPVDLPAFLARQSALDRQCLYFVSDIEATSQRIQALGGRTRYLSPILAGTGMGAAVAYAALAQAPAATLAGAASDGFTTRIATPKPLCTDAPYTPAAEGGFRYGPHTLPGWWRVAPAADEATAAQAFAAAAGQPAEAVVTPSPGTGLADRLAALIEAPLAAEAASTALPDLPLVELPTDAGGRLMAVIYSGDGGWRDLDKEIGSYLQEQGVPVVGVDSLRYFWAERTPEQVAADLAAILDHYREAWRRPEVLLIGYSFGADILPFAYNRLPEEARRAVRRIVLLGFAKTAEFEIRLAGWLGMEAETGPPTAPEVRRIAPGLIQCFYGEEEEDSGCTLPELAAAELIRTKGGHHFDGNYQALAQAILAGASAAARP